VSEVTKQEVDVDVGVVGVEVDVEVGVGVEVEKPNYEPPLTPTLSQGRGNYDSRDPRYPYDSLLILSLGTPISLSAASADSRNLGVGSTPCSFAAFRSHGPIAGPQA
jgi:hypothetical protein